MKKKVVINKKYLGTSFDDFKKEVYTKEELQVLEARVKLLSSMGNHGRDDFSQYLEQQLQDPEFKKEWDSNETD